MENKMGINFIRPCVPTKLERIEDGEKKGMIRVYAKYNDGTDYEDVFNTVLFAVGRQADTEKLGVDAVGVTLNPKNKKCIVDEGILLHANKKAQFFLGVNNMSFLSNNMGFIPYNNLQAKQLTSLIYLQLVI